MDATRTRKGKRTEGGRRGGNGGREGDLSEKLEEEEPAPPLSVDDNRRTSVVVGCMVTSPFFLLPHAS